MTRRAKLISSAAVLLLVVLFVVRGFPSSTDVPIFRTRFTTRYGEDLLAARMNGVEEVLITRVAPEYKAHKVRSPEPAYAYNMTTAEVSEASPLQWANAAGTIVTTATLPSRPCEWLIGIFDDKLVASKVGGIGRRLQTEGRHPLDVVVSSDARFVAVLTADGPEKPAKRSWWFPSGGGVGGQHYVEFFEVASEAERPVQTIRIGFKTARAPIELLWSPSDRFLVVASDEHRISVIPVRGFEVGSTSTD